MKLAIHDVSVVKIIDSKNIQLRVEYTPENGDTTIDYGTYSVAENAYYCGIDMDKHEAEFYALQERIENR
jgi:hypothetical protein